MSQQSIRRWHSASICESCFSTLYLLRSLDSVPRLRERDVEYCWECGRANTDGIFVRRYGIKGDPQI